ncbi:hypothetical protein NP493_521g00004 [Ridgeia piscesae]|uniref:Uncharacterized protein n=1 Tax=Ridgeia piscesae TaxID=27915 RepID=A0AAD9KY55_RIDPI|nr:hypothetical protein NP493_521g00004 [Ridgeia piscesae]
MQRCAATEKERREKPGRAIVTFLLIVNLALWILRTFQVKTIALEDHLEFYGVPAWPIILNINLPLMLFFRFHSSVCLADIWMAAYIADEKSIRPVGL